MHSSSPAHTSMAPLGTRDVEHREDFRRFVLDDAEPWHREHLGRLYQLWEQYNELYFDAGLVPPYILLTEPAGPRTYADCGAVSGFGGRSQMRIRPSLLAGTHPHLRGAAEGRRRFVADVLLHETIHQWQQELSGQTEQAWHGHGPAFRDRANAIGRVLRLGPVRTAKRRGADRELPSCASWPYGVRPLDYYLGAYRPPASAPGDGAEHPDGPAADGDAPAACGVVLTPDEWRRVQRLVARQLTEGFGSDDAAEHQCWRRLLDKLDERIR
jgi:hypothetical protein